MRESGYPFQEVEGEAAFYGPKVDFMIRSVVGTEYAISTNQLDFVAAKRFNLSYQSADGKEEPVYVIHRAPLGIARALHRVPDRALRREIPDLARAGAGGGDPDLRAARRICPLGARQAECAPHR